MRNALAVLSAALIVGASAATTATATVNWATSSSPQSVTGYSSWAKTYGTWDAVKGTSGSYDTVRSYMPAAYYKYYDADNHTVYVRTSTNVTAGSSIISSTSSASSHDNVYSNAWTAFRSRPSSTMSMQFNGSVKVTTGVHTCLDVPFRIDPCSSAKMVSEYLNL
jgi:hypothetical protein